MLKSLLYFVLTGLCEIGGGYLIWLWLREAKSIWFAFFKAALLILYKVIPTLQGANFGRVYVAYPMFLLFYQFFGDGKWTRLLQTSLTS